MEADLIARLTGDTAIAAILGDRISWFGGQRNDAAPYLVISKVSLVEDWSHDGPDAVDQVRLQFDLYAKDSGELPDAVAALRARMRQAETVGETRFWPALTADEQWFDEGEQDGGKALFRASMDFQFFHEEA